jgi:hypothetical protein
VTGEDQPIINWDVWGLKYQTSPVLYLTGHAPDQFKGQLSNTNTISQINGPLITEKTSLKIDTINGCLLMFTIKTHT